MSNKLRDLDININCCRHNNFNIVVKISVWNNLEVKWIQMKNWTSKFIQAALALSFSRVEEIKNNRIKELLEMKLKIKNDPIVVENWFDNEINKIINVTENSSYSTDLECIINKIK